MLMSKKGGRSEFYGLVGDVAKIVPLLVKEINRVVDIQT